MLCKTAAAGHYGVVDSQGLLQNRAFVVTSIVGLAILSLTLLVLLLRRRSGGVDPMRSLERIGQRLELLERLSTDIGNLSQLFLIPHARGGLGETLLAEILRTWLPDRSFSLQYSFRSGARVDAVIRLGEYLVPIDAKFPLEGMRRALTNPTSETFVTGEVRQAFTRHIRGIGEKYILPDEGTLHFALMYIPSERIYYHAFVEKDSGLLDLALQQDVVPVSPGSLFLYLQTVAYGLKGFSFPRKQVELMRAVQQLSKELVDLSRSFGVAGGHLKNLQKAYDEAHRRLQRLDVSVNRIGSPDASDSLE